MQTVTEGNVSVDSNVGTADELKAELATETPRQRERIGKLTTVANKTADTATTERAAGQADDDAGDDDDSTGKVDATADASKAGQALTKRKKSLQARIDEISAEKHTTARERDQARADVTRLQSELDAAKGVKSKDTPTEQPKTVGGVALDAAKFPKYGDWLKTAPETANDLEDWVDARDSWKDAKVEAKATEETARREHSERFTPIATKFHERMAPTLKEDPQFYDKIDPRLMDTKAASALPPGVKPNFGNFIVDLAFKSEYPKDMLLWLSDDKIIRRLVTLQPEDIIREFTKKELSIRPSDAVTGPSDAEQDDDDETDADAEKQTRRGSRDVETVTSQAEPPVKPVRGSSQQLADQEPGDDASDDEWYRSEVRRTKKKTSRAH